MNAGRRRTLTSSGTWNEHMRNPTPAYAPPQPVVPVTVTVLSIHGIFDSKPLLFLTEGAPPGTGAIVSGAAAAAIALVYYVLYCVPSPPLLSLLSVALRCCCCCCCCCCSLDRPTLAPHPPSHPPTFLPARPLPCVPRLHSWIQLVPTVCTIGTAAVLLGTAHGLETSAHELFGLPETHTLSAPLEHAEPLDAPPTRI